MPPATESVMASLPRERAGVGSAVNNTIRQVGGALGVAVLGSVLSSVYRGDMKPTLAGLPAQVPDAARQAASESVAGAHGAAARLGAAGQGTPLGTVAHSLADSANAVVVGTPDAKTRRRYDAVRRALEEGIALCRPGIVAKELDRRIRELLAEHGPTYHHHSGHAVGVDYSIPPRITPYEELPIEEGMVIALEPAIYEPGWGGIRLEHIFLVGAGGNELKSRVGAGSHARVLHGEHAVAMPEAIVACHDTLRRGVLKGLVFRRMHFLHLSAPDGLGDLFNDTFDTFLRSSCFPFDTLFRGSCCSSTGIFLIAPTSG